MTVDKLGHIFDILFWIVRFSKLFLVFVVIWYIIAVSKFSVIDYPLVTGRILLTNVTIKNCLKGIYETLTYLHYFVEMVRKVIQEVLVIEFKHSQVRVFLFVSRNFNYTRDSLIFVRATLLLVYL